MSALDDVGPALPRIARQAIVEWLSGDGYGDQRAEGPLAEGPVFVSLLAGDGALRACMGYWSSGGSPSTSVTTATLRAAVSAAVHDPRFPPVAVPELAQLRVSVAVATAPVPVTSAQQIAPEIHGVLVRDAVGREGFLMPGLPGVQDGAHLVWLGCDKAGIDAGAPVTLRTFTVTTWADG